MLIHEIKRNTPRKSKRQVGRGGKRGKTSGRGTKGQKARSGRKLRPEIRDYLKKIPKLRGRGKNSNLSIQGKPTVFNIEVLEKKFSDGAEISPVILAKKGLIKSISGRLPVVKILAGGEVKKKFSVTGCLLSAKAKSKLEAVGGVIK